MALAEFDDISEAIRLAAKVDVHAISSGERADAVVELQRLNARRR